MRPESVQASYTLRHRFFKLIVTSPISDLILIKFLINQLILSLFLEGDDDQGNEDVDEEEWKDDEVDYVEDGHLHPVAWQRSLVLRCRFNRVLQDPDHEQISNPATNKQC